MTTQTKHPWRAAVRTGVAIFLSLGAFLTVALPMAMPFLEQYLPPEWIGYVVGFVGFVSGLAVLVNRLMLTPQFNKLFEAMGLGAAPKIEAFADSEENGGT